MKKVILRLKFSLFFFLIICNKSVSQVSKVEYYAHTKNTIDTTGIRSYLLFNNKKSLFIWRSLANTIKNSTEVSKDFDNRINFKKIINDTIGTRVLNNYSDDKLILRSPLMENNFIIIDKKVELIWKIENEFKEFLNLKCQKATVEFRGRNYIAWFTTQIPVPAGPWKLNGLPGLILEAYDENREVNFLFKSITMNSTQKEEIDIQINENAITIKEFVKLNDNLHSKLINQAISKLPRDVKVESNYDNERKGIEIVYEWENEN